MRETKKLTSGFLHRETYPSVCHLFALVAVTAAAAFIEPHPARPDEVHWRNAGRQWQRRERHHAVTDAADGYRNV